MIYNKSTQHRRHHRFKNYMQSISFKSNEFWYTKSGSAT